jgi:uncharacterized YceG family protein
MTIETEKRERALARVLIVVSLVAVGLVAVVLLGKFLADAVTQTAPVTTTVQAGIPVTVEVAEGASARTIGDTMESAGVVSRRDLVRVVESQGIASQLKPGTYLLETGMTPEQVAQRLVNGPDVASDSVIVLEGVTIAAAIESLAEQTGYDTEDFAAPLRDERVTSPYLPTELPEGVDELAKWEGLLYPARYAIDDDATPREILQLMADEMVRRVGGVDRSRLEELGVSEYEAIIIASLIEREAGVEEDRPVIASVVYNRLDLGMPLQIDATVIYARGTPGHVLTQDLGIDSPWNTYQFTGLPPTPISTVRVESLKAAANPADTDYLYYVLVSEDGHHGFSTTYEEHQAKVEQAKADGILP